MDHPVLLMTYGLTFSHNLSLFRHQSKGLSLSAGGQNMPDVVEVITKLAANFTKLIELMLSKEIKVS